MLHNDNILFLGTPQIAAAHLRTLIDANEKVVGVISRPDKPRGRGRKLTPTPVKQIAVDNELEVIQPEDPRDEEVINWVKQMDPWLIVVVAYGRILPPGMLGIPPAGSWNVHASLLPRWRGAAPVARSIQHGDIKTGITLMMMDAGLDTGDIILQSETEIGSDETCGELEARLETMGCKLLIEGIKMAREDRLEVRSQPEQGATYAAPIKKQEAQIDWKRTARELHNHIRAMSPRPGARTGQLKIFKSSLPLGAESTGAPGAVAKIESSGVMVNTGEGLIELVELQPPGKRRMQAADYARGRRLAATPPTPRRARRPSPRRDGSGYDRRGVRTGS